MSVSLPNIHVEALTPNVMVLGGRAFGRWSGLDKIIGWGPGEGVGALKEETPECLLSPGHVRTR